MKREIKTEIKKILWGCLGASILIPAFYILNELSKNLPPDLAQTIGAVFFTFFITFGISIANASTVFYLQRRLPWQTHTRKRLIIEFVWTSMNALIIINAIISILYILFPEFPHPQSPEVHFSNSLIAIIMNFILMTIWEAGYIVNQWKYKLVENEKLLRESIESQYASLIHQLSPHFLFNSLNALSSLINTDPARAQKFVGRFSDIYRYVLDAREKTLASLAEELDFLQAYLFLQQIRYDDHLQVDIRITTDPQASYVLPLSLQLLIENSIKHNEISSEHQLEIKVYDDQNFLIVENDYKPRKRMEESKGIGQQNLIDRYSHFSEQKPGFGIVNQKYLARIPLIKEEI